jgi:O-antigen/teichoic acid export membrane protein
VTGTELLLGVFMLPFNVAHLGQSAYGLWVLVASITIYFSMLDLGYGLAHVRFAAKYRAEGNIVALNEMASTMFFVFSLIGLVALGVAVLISGNLSGIFNLNQSQDRTARLVLLVISSYVALSFPASVFGGIVNGFQRTYLNGAVAFITAITVALVNVIVLFSGYGLAELVIATTAVRILSLFAYTLNAYRVFPALRIRRKYFSKQRLREATGFSVYALLIDIANKLNYSSDALIIGAFLGTASVAVWAVAQRLIEIVQRITDQLNSALFPVVVDSATFQDHDKLQKVLLQGTRLSLASVVPVATSLSLLAKPLVLAWVGSDFLGGIPIIYVLSIAVAVRVGIATSSMILKGSGEHRLVALANSAMAVANICLSIVLVHFYGLVGVALGTVTPMVLVSLGIVFPAACRRVSISKLRVIRYAMWPALWPAVPMTLVLLITSRITGGWVGLLTRAALGATTYVLFFLTIAISKDEREWYFGKVRHILGLST